MWECSYSREPVNFRVVLLRIMKKIWVLPVAAVIGAIIVFGVYFFAKTVILGRVYLVEDMYHIDYSEDAAGNEYDFVNEYTWEVISDADVIMNVVYEALGGEVDKETLKDYTNCTVDSDGRLLVARIITPDPELSRRVADAYEKGISSYVYSHREFDNIEKDHAGTPVDGSNIRTKEMLIVGAVAGLLIAILYYLISGAVDTSVYIPATLEYRYHIPTLGAPSMEEYSETCRHLLKDSSKTALVKLEEDTPEVALECAGSVSVFENPVFFGDKTAEIRNCDKVVIAVKAANHNGKRLERLIEYFARQEITVSALVLCNEDKKFISKYYEK